MDSIIDIKELVAFTNNISAKPYLPQTGSRSQKLRILFVTNDAVRDCDVRNKGMTFSGNEVGGVSFNTLFTRQCIDPTAKDEEYRIRLRGDTLWNRSLREPGFISRTFRWFADDCFSKECNEENKPHAIFIDDIVPMEDKNLIIKYHDAIPINPTTKQIKHLQKKRIIDEAIAGAEKRGYKDGHKAGVSAEAFWNAVDSEIKYNKGYNDGRNNTPVIMVQTNNETQRSKDYESGFFDGKKAQEKLMKADIDKAYQKGYQEGMSIQRQADENNRN